MAQLKFVPPLSEEDKQQLRLIYETHSVFRCRQRAHAILLSNDHYTIAELQDIFQVDRDTISLWLDRFAAFGLAGLEDLPRSGRPLIYTDEEINKFKDLIDEEPPQITQAQVKLQQNTGKNSCTETLCMTKNIGTSGFPVKLSKF
jgi:predicted transcriptional regulator